MKVLLVAANTERLNMMTLPLGLVRTVESGPRFS